MELWIDGTTALLSLRRPCGCVPPYHRRWIWSFSRLPTHGTNQPIGCHSVSHTRTHIPALHLPWSCRDPGAGGGRECRCACLASPCTPLSGLPLSLSLCLSPPRSSDSFFFLKRTVQIVSWDGRARSLIWKPTACLFPVRFFPFLGDAHPRNLQEPGKFGFWGPESFLISRWAVTPSDVLPRRFCKS
jgi:hypothetical protein